MILQMKSPALVAARNRAEVKQRTFTISAAIPLVKQHGPDLLALLVVLGFIGFSACC